jgi:predicted acetyltransferase
MIPEFRALSKESKKEIFGFLIGVDEENNLCTIRTEDDV